MGSDINISNTKNYKEEKMSNWHLVKDPKDLEISMDEKFIDVLFETDLSGNNYVSIPIEFIKALLRAKPLDAQVIPQGELSLCERYGHAMYSVYIMDNYATGGSSKWGENKCSRCGYTDTWQYDE
jgi:hypothetical protein